MPKQPDPDARRFKDRQEKERDYQKQLPGEDENPLPPPVEPIQKSENTPGRNDPCTCGSGKKYKLCCGK